MSHDSNRTRVHGPEGATLDPPGGVRGRYGPMPAVSTNGIELFYEEDGDRDGTPLVLVTGLAAQLTSWPEPFVAGLVARGFRVVRPDNRDSGLTTRFHGVDVFPFEVDPARVPYLLSDMAADIVGLLDHLDIGRAHLVGASMGGMIAQALAIDHPERVLSLCSIMSSTGAGDVGAPTAEAVMALVGPVPTDRESAQARALQVAAVIGSRSHPADPEEVRRRAGDAYDRAHYPEGATRQLAAMMASGDRTERLRRLQVPTVVVHGLQDTLIQPDGGRATAAAVPGARLVELEEMGHDLPEHLVPHLVEVIVDNARRAGG